MQGMSTSLLIVLFGGIVFASVGFALFSDTLSVDGTATANATFDITATCTSGIKQEIATLYNNAWSNSVYSSIAMPVENNDYISNAFCTPNGNDVSFGGYCYYAWCCKVFYS